MTWIKEYVCEFVPVCFLEWGRYRTESVGTLGRLVL